MSVQVNDDTSGTITNNAWVSLSSETITDPNPDNDSTSEDTTIGETGADLSITKTDSADPVAPGGELRYTITVTNAGPEAAEDVVVRDEIPAKLTYVSEIGCLRSDFPQCLLGTIHPGQSKTVTMITTVNAGAEGTITNVATVSSNISDPDFDNNEATEETTIAQSVADLVVTITGTPDPVQPGGELIYRVEVSNSGPDDANNVVITNTLPASVTFVSSTGCIESDISDCFLGSIAAGSSKVVTILVTVNEDATGTITNTVVASSDSTDPNPGDASSSVDTAVGEGNADLSITKTDSADPVGPGEEFTYTVTVTNNGPDAAANVVVTDTLPTGLTLISSSGCIDSDISNCSLGMLAAGSSASFSMLVAVSADASGVLTNTASVTSDTPDSNQGNNSVTESTTIRSATATLTVSKDFSDDNPASVQIGLSCTDASVDGDIKPASEASAAVFNLTNVGDANRCTAEELDAPEGYQPDAGSCSDLAVGPGSSVECEIVNTLQTPETTFTVNKVFSDDNDAEVQVSLSCTDALVDEDTKSASSSEPATFVLTEVGAENECTATESGVPEGYLTDASSCQNVTVLEGDTFSCQITNVRLPDLPPQDTNEGETFGTILETCPSGENVGGFQELCNGLLGGLVTGSDIDQALQQITADDAASVRSAGMQTTNVQISAVDGRLGTLRGGGGAGFSASGFSVGIGDLSMNGNLLKSFLTNFDQNAPEFMQANASQNDTGYLDEFGRWGVWVSGRIVFGEKDRTTNQIDYDFNTAGLTFGMDYRYTDEFVAGLAVGYADTDADIGADDGELSTRGYSVSLYGTWFRSDRFYMAGSLSYGNNDYEQLRNVRYRLKPEGSDTGNAVFNVDQTLDADYGGSQYGAVISGGWDFSVNGWTLGPTFRVAYVDVDVDAYDERLFRSNVDFGPGGVGWGVHIDGQSFTSLQPAIGFEVSKVFNRTWGVVIPQGYIDVVSELEDGPTILSGWYLGDALGQSNRFNLQTDDFKETFARGGLGLGFVLKNNKSAFFTVDADLGRDILTTYYINAGFRWQF
jgi:uncharacterized repeat protein (TIGR01451 family)/outer membrane autotransporter protein